MLTTAILPLDSLFDASATSPLIRLIEQQSETTRTPQKVQCDELGQCLARHKTHRNTKTRTRRFWLKQNRRSHNETESDQPPGAMLADLAIAIKVSADELLGITTPKERTNPKLARLMNRLKRVAELPPNDQRAILQHVDALVDARSKKKRLSGKSSA